MSMFPRHADSLLHGPVNYCHVNLSLTISMKSMLLMKALKIKFDKCGNLVYL